METMQFLGIRYPSEFEDPFWDAYEAQMQDTDLILFLRKIQNNLFIGAGGTLNWNGGSGVLTWTDDFVIPVFHWGRRILVRYGTDNLTRAVNLLDGQALVVTVPVVMNQDVTVNFSVVSQLTPTAHNQWVAGWRVGSNLQLKGIGQL